MSGIYYDEHQKYQIDLSSSIWSTDKLQDKYRTIGGELSDVDWIAETEQEILLIEYKNTSFIGKNGKNEFYNKMWKKYYGSMFFLLSRLSKKIDEWNRQYPHFLIIKIPQGILTP